MPDWVLPAAARSPRLPPPRAIVGVGSGTSGSAVSAGICPDRRASASSSSSVSVSAGNSDFSGFGSSGIPDWVLPAAARSPCLGAAAGTDLSLASPALSRSPITHPRIRRRIHREPFHIGHNRPNSQTCRSNQVGDAQEAHPERLEVL